MTDAGFVRLATASLPSGGAAGLPANPRQKRPDLAARAKAAPRGAGGRFAPVHGAYALVHAMQEGRLDRRRLETRDYLTFRARLVRDLGAASPDGLSAQQQALALEC